MNGLNEFAGWLAVLTPIIRQLCFLKNLFEKQFR
jgi:hypothetical protein